MVTLTALKFIKAQYSNIYITKRIIKNINIHDFVKIIFSWHLRKVYNSEITKTNILKCQLSKYSKIPKFWKKKINLPKLTDKMSVER